MNLRVFYGWAKTGKVRKKEAISVIFENECQREDRTQRAISKYQHTVYVRPQTEKEREDAKHSNRVFSEYSIFLDEKRLQGSLELALKANYESDSNNVSDEVRGEIANALRESYLQAHPGYKEPIVQLELQLK
ncbi:MAG: hypothetical protein NC411_01310 [Bacteroides sp.]|nr:hypothetical protein [Bacteroides sp.]